MTTDALAYNKLATKLQLDIRKAQMESLIGEEANMVHDIHSLILCSYAEVAKLVEEALTERDKAAVKQPPAPLDGGDQ